MKEDLVMIKWIKAVVITIGLFFTSLNHYFWPNKPQEEIIDDFIATIVKEQTGFDIDPIEEQIDDIEDFLQ